MPLKKNQRQGRSLLWTTVPAERMPLKKNQRQGVYIGAVVASLWLVAVLGGMSLLNRKANTPGHPANPPLQWPAESNLPRDDKNPTLLLFAHPRCPCTRATLGELEVLLARFPDRVNAHLVFIKPHNTSAQWLDTPLWRDAATVPGLSVHSDEGAVESHLFRSVTSGQVIAYDQDGLLVFHGGITAARGHSGDNSGRTTLEQILAGELKGGSNHTVFGCPLFDADCEEGGSLCKN